MKKIFSLFIILISFLYPLSISAQEVIKHNFCGLTHDNQEIIYQQMMENRVRYGENVQMRAVAYVPLALHLVAKTDGSGRVSITRVLDVLDGVNASYARNGLEIQFYIKYINLPNSDELYDSPSNFAGFNKAFSFKKTDAMNIYFCNDAGTGSIAGGTTLGVYWPRVSTDQANYSADWIYIKNSEILNGTSPTVEHEIGHFFSLPHTFRGYDQEPFKPTVANACAPKIAPNSVHTSENAARTGTDANCSTAGDGFCDTPADYNLGYGWNTCNYTGIAKDPLCIAVDPDETNLMGYFPSSCTKNFSAMQKSAIMNDYSNNAARRYLRNGNTTPSLIAMTDPTLITPAHNATITNFTPVVLDWSDVNGVTGGVNRESGYIFEISTVTSFLVNTVRILTPSSNLTIDNTNLPAAYLKANTRYYWRVRPYGTYKTGGQFSNYNSFITGTVNSITEIEGVKDFSVSPNPTQSARSLSIELSSDKAFTGIVRLVNTAGQVVQNTQMNFIQGQNSQTIDISNMNTGMYFLTIQYEKGILNKKVVITK